MQKVVKRRIRREYKELKLIHPQMPGNLKIRADTRPIQSAAAPYIAWKVPANGRSAKRWSAAVLQDGGWQIMIMGHP